MASPHVSFGESASRASGAEFAAFLGITELSAQRLTGDDTFAGSLSADLVDGAVGRPLPPNA
jgi:hypothetical protein